MTFLVPKYDLFNMLIVKLKRCQNLFHYHIPVNWYTAEMQCWNCWCMYVHWVPEVTPWWWSSLLWWGWWWVLKDFPSEFKSICSSEHFFDKQTDGGHCGYHNYKHGGGRRRRKRNIYVYHINMMKISGIWSQIGLVSEYIESIHGEAEVPPTSDFYRRLEYNDDVSLINTGTNWIMLRHIS